MDVAEGARHGWPAALAAAAMALLAGPGWAHCADGRFEGVGYTACSFDPAQVEMRVFHRDADGAVYGHFGALRGALAARGRDLIAAMNGAMYHEDRRAVGYYVEDGVERAPLVTADGPGNFGLLPNGVFCIAGTRAAVIESRAFAAAPMACDSAVQSGPLLVEAGALHPRFIPDSDSRYVRNGVGVRADGTVVWAITDGRINFHRFARLMRDALDTPDALYVDGNVSRLYAPALGRNDPGFAMGPILAVIE